MTLTFGSLFSGIGGMDLGLERSGMRCVWQVEIDNWCRRVLTKHWPDVRRHDDVRTFPPPSSGEWGCDPIVGGDPCQGNSNAGSVHKGVERDSLGPEFLRVVAMLRPRLVLRENPLPESTDALMPARRFRAELQSLGYGVLPFRMRACCVGAFHKRERLFLLAGLPDANGHGLERFDREGFEERHARGVGGYAGKWRRNFIDSLPEPIACRSRHGVSAIVDRLRGLGNAVVPQVAEWIGERILASLNETKQ